MKRTRIEKNRALNDALLESLSAHEYEAVQRLARYMHRSQTLGESGQIRLALSAIVDSWIRHQAIIHIEADSWYRGYHTGLEAACSESGIRVSNNVLD